MPASQKQSEIRSSPGELRAAGDDGIIEGYVAVWNTVDDYNSTFQKGAFAKTLQERGSRVKVLWNHGDEVIGTPLILREDDRGLFFRGQLLMTIQSVRDNFERIKAGAIDTFSFGFRTIKDKWVDGVRVITEVMLMEISPVIFEANAAARITGVRAMPDEKRAQDYKATYEQYELGRRGELILSALYRTLDDIWYGGAQGDELRAKVGDALTTFSAMYSVFTDDMVAASQRDQRGSPLAQAVRSYFAEANLTPEQLAANTSLTADEVRSLLTDMPAASVAGKINDLPESVRAAYGAARLAKVEALFAELRAGFQPAEIDRLRGLLPPQEDPHAAAYSAINKTLEQFRSSLVAPH